jgi:hypothetical protein|tara:strand:+ start:1042 stop:1908 length:867 start_codon:yes stop_codon:yes gene_type:complete
VLSTSSKPILSIDNTLTSTLEEEVRAGRASLDDGVLLPLSKSDKSKIVYRKYEAQSPDLSDTSHKEWETTMVAHPKLAILGMEDRLLDDEIVGVSEDDGLILRFVGTAESTVAIDMNNGRVIKEEEAELLEETMGLQVPRYTEWCFRLGWVKLTNGPESRRKLAETYERQKNMEQAEMFNSMEKFFGKLMGRLDDMGQSSADPNQVAMKDGEIVNTESFLQEMLKKNSPEQMKALIDLEAPDEIEPLSAEELAEEQEMLAQEEKAISEAEEPKEVEAKTPNRGRPKKK